jgi:hypothetical protein
MVTVHSMHWREIRTICKGKRPLWKPRRRLEDNIKIDLKELGWIHLAQNRDKCLAIVNTTNEYLGFIKS